MAFRSLFAALLAAVLLVSTAQAQTYLDPGEVNLTRLLPPPPPADSARSAEDLKALLDLQAQRTPDMAQAAREDVSTELARFSQAVGADLSPERVPLTTALIKNAYASARPVVGAAKAYWKRPRPYLAHPEITPALPLEKSFSYPSGHSTYGMMTGILLANMVPERAEQLFARGMAYGQQRLIGGVHYPSDVQAGRTAATVLVAFLLDDDAFQTDLSAATIELRTVLGLPPLAATPQPAQVLPAAAE